MKCQMQMVPCTRTSKSGLTLIEVLIATTITLLMMLALAQGFKTLTGASRKWAIPLAEYFDQKKITLRIGDVRKLRGA